MRLVRAERPEISANHYMPMRRPFLVKMILDVLCHRQAIRLKVLALLQVFPRSVYRVLQDIVRHVVAHLHLCAPHHTPFVHVTHPQLH